VTACSYLPAATATSAGSAQSAPRLILVVDQEEDRLEVTAGALRTLAPGARVQRQGETATSADVILAHASPGIWSVAAVLAAHSPARRGRPVDAFLVADGPLEKFSVQITDFPGLRLLPPDAEVAAEVAALILAGGRAATGR
jgi:hypothetical protein